jgi:hypothetical protein
MLRSSGEVVGLFVLLATACGGTPDSTTPSSGGDGGSGNSGGTASNAGDPGTAVPFCAALTVIRDKCQRCHGEPLQHGAPAPFLTYQDTQAPYYTTDKKWWEVMIPAVTKDLMPYVALNDPPTNIKPPVEPLTVEEKATLLGWLEQGAKPEGGTDCR